MTTDASIALVIVMLACGTSPLRLEAGAESSQGVRVGCELATRRCSRCHSLDRVTTTQIASPVAWQAYVQQMRRLPGSGIAPREARPIVECLVYRSFGDAGLAELAMEQAP